jgi:DNA-binding XRE family transcriptional regulator
MAERKIAGSPIVNGEKFMKNVLLLLANSPFRLTGHQIQFVRQYFEMSLRRFGEQFDVSHTTVIKWEKAEDNIPPIKWPIEKDIRLFILDKLKSNARLFQKIYQSLRKKK